MGAPGAMRQGGRCEAGWAVAPRTLSCMLPSSLRTTMPWLRERSTYAVLGHLVHCSLRRDRFEVHSISGDGYIKFRGA